MTTEVPEHLQVFTKSYYTDLVKIKNLDENERGTHKYMKRYMSYNILEEYVEMRRECESMGIHNLLLEDITELIKENESLQVAIKLKLENKKRA